MIRPNSPLLTEACDKNIEDIFTGITDESAECGEYFEVIVELCEGKIGKLTEEAMDAYQKGCKAANSRRKKVGETFEDVKSTYYDYEATQTYLDNKAGKTNKSVSSAKRKEFFFKEKIQ